jgi:hypothetical protein
MRENFNRAVLASTGDYVIVFGDDDAILPGQFPVLRHLLAEQRPDGISWSRATYGWPIEDFGKKTGGLRFYRDQSFGTPTEYDPRSNLGKLMRCDLHTIFPASDLYHGCVSRAYLDRHRPAADLYFDSTIPDVNFHYRSIYAGGRFLNLRHPFTINGYSPVSTGGAHTGPKPGTESEKIGESFIAENQADPYNDVIEHTLAIQLVYFSTLETLRSRSGFEEPKPDYTAWYQYALAAQRLRPQQADSIGQILLDYAQRTGTTTQLESARGMPAHSKRSLKEKLLRIRSQLRSFRLSAAIAGENTVQTATEVMDNVLGDELRAILDGDQSQRGAWAAAKRRSKAYERQL